jgi:hypothetical protein
MRVRIEITDDRVECKTNGRLSHATSVADFLDAAAGRIDFSALPEAIPAGTRFIQRRGDRVVLAVEEPPGVRTVRWVTTDSLIRMGPEASYRTARLSFPFLVLVAALDRGALSRYLQCFYRCAPLRTLEDSLLYPNILNVRAKDGLPCWLCLKLPNDLSRLSWEEKVGTIRSHLWGQAFNDSAGTVYWETMREIDPRVATVDVWEQATAEDPFFTLTVPWRAVGRTVATVMGDMLNVGRQPGVPGSAVDLAAVAALCPPYPGTGKAQPALPRGKRT